MAKGKNRIRKLHSSARNSREGEGGGAGRKWLAGLAIAAAIALAVGGAVAYSKLREAWIEQCEIVDVARQVSVTTGANIKPGLILDQFGIRKGANLALIDFEAKRRTIMEKLPNIRSLTVERHLPDRVSIYVEEREPVAQMNVRGNRAVTGRVVDTEGVVFLRQSGTSLLPVIVERAQPGTPVGKRLTGRALAALRLLEAAREDEFSDVGVLCADVSPQDYIMITLRNYSQAKFAWEGMDVQTAESAGALADKLTKLRNAVKADLDGGAKTWNATLPDRVTCNPIGRIP